MLGPILASLLLTAATGLAEDSSKPPGAQEYDYIIVGGGTAGNALATRLSQGLKKASILVIEAGPAALHEDGINVPGLKGSTLGGKYDWNFTTVPQPYLKNRAIFTPRGRVLGGTSALNFLTWDRASAVEYDSWEAVGNPGWNWRTMTAAMEKAETYINGPPGSGTSGPIHAVINRVDPVHQKSFIPTVSTNFPIPYNPDSLQGNPIGVMYQPENINPASYNRSYSANAYLPLPGPNLSLLTNTLITKITFSPSPPKPRDRPQQQQQPLLRATGVTLANGTSLTARLSNYQDHLLVHVSYQLKEEYPAGDELGTNATFAAEEWAKRLRGEPGFYDDTGGGYVFADWKRVVPGGEDGALVRLARGVVDGKGRANVGLRKQLEMLGDARVPQAEVIYSDGYTGVKGYPPVGSALYGKGFFTLIGGLMHPLSRGSVHVNPADPGGKPVINPRFLDNVYDLAGVVEILKFCRRIARAEPLRSVWVQEYEPGEALVRTDEDWREYIRNTTLTIFHPMGTAAMLPRKDGGVVDSKLTVYGTANLRVVDASIIPVEISAHPQTAVYGIAERAAEIIIAAHR